MTRKYLLDLIERVGWTAVQAVAAFLLVEWSDSPLWYVAFLTPVLSAVKGLAARKLGDSESAALVRPPAAE